jgi:MFS transporter, Spinster family, sphingosine-1-phosphate transporter
MLGLLTLLNVLNFVDRTLIASLAPLLIADLGLNRAQIGLLAGFGFVFFYSFVGLFLGLAADRWPRLKLMAIGLALWSAMTAVSGLARSFVQLAVPRVLVGVGEATLTPAALSVLGDVFPRRRLGFASGVYYAGIPLGTAASLLVAGYVAPRWGWRSCFLVLGVLGVVAAGGVLFLREPARRGAGFAAPRPDLGALARDAMRAITGHRTLLLALAGGSLLCYGSASALHGVTWLVEERGFSFADAAYASGVVAVVGGVLGNFVGGAFGDACARWWAGGRLWSLVGMTAFFAPIGVVFYTSAPATPLFYACWFVTSAGTTAWFGPLFAVIQEESPAHTRSSMVAFALLVINLLGVGPGPLVTGMIGDARSLTAGLLVSLVVVALAIVPFALAARLRPAPVENP